jgi:hypothetical protein
MTPCASGRACMDTSEGVLEEGTMGSVFGTCGHDVTNTGEHGMGFPIAIKDTDREGNTCISHIVVCADCLKWYQKKKLIVEED